MAWLLALVACSFLSVLFLALIAASHVRAYLQIPPSRSRRWRDLVAFTLLPVSDSGCALALGWFFSVPPVHAVVVGLLFCIASLRLTEALMRVAERFRSGEGELEELSRRKRERPSPGFGRMLGYVALASAVWGGVRTLVLALAMLLVAAALHG